jgi:hypothetical protein
MKKKIIKFQALVRGYLCRKKQPLTSLKLRKLSFHIKNTNEKKKTQLDYYIKNKSSIDILYYVDTPGKSFGEKYMENVAREYFKLDKKTNTTHDHVKLSQTIEQKSARYHANGTDWKWQHIEMKHHFDHLLLCGLDFHCIRFFISSREKVEKLIQLKIITGQGKKINGSADPQQGYWFSRSDFKKKNVSFDDYFQEIMNEKDLVYYLENY